MCGILSVPSSRWKLQWTMFRSIEKIVEDQHSRGPDNAAIQGIASSTLRAVFGHNRLAIIDLTANANQPMWDSSGRLCLIYNGEIYNYVELRDELRALGHRFKSESDSEVILEAYRAWGDAAFQRFNGPFAFALFDVNADRVLLVRDRFGVKPLFYSMTKDRVVFASTAAACGQVLGLPPSAAYIARGLAHGIYDDDALAPFTGLAAVPSGGVVSITSDTGRIQDRSETVLRLARTGRHDDRRARGRACWASDRSTEVPRSTTRSTSDSGRTYRSLSHSAAVWIQRRSRRERTGTKGPSSASPSGIRWIAVTKGQRFETSRRPKASR